MCGITGVFNLDGASVSPTDLRRMASTLAHRGPDGEGFYGDGCLGLAHRRLAVIDLSPAGHQPMISADGQVVLTYNGEIYNFQELRLSLESLGYQFHSKTDSEVVLNAYHAWGVKALEKFNGMFAFAIWDKRKQELILARDRYGIKPLYYSLQGSTFLFGSEVKALLAHPAHVMDIDKKALLEYFTFQNFFTNRTLFKGVFLLSPASYLIIPLGSQAVSKPVSYWDYSFEEPKKPLDEKVYVEELSRLFQQAVRRQLVSDVPLGSYLSGGIDSGSIAAVAAGHLPYIKTFTVGFDLSSASGVEMAYDERPQAERLSALYRTEHYEMVLKSGDMERVIPALTWHLEEPRVGQSYPNYYAAKLASKFVTVVVSGAGGDELFGGYPWRYYRAVVNDHFEDYIDKYYHFWQRLIPNQEIQQVFAPIWDEVKDVWTRDIFKDVFLHHNDQFLRPEDYVNHSLYFEAKTFLHGLLTVEDKLSMAHSLEVRVPFLDNDLVDFAMKIPVGMKLGKLGEVVRLNENDPGNKIEKYFNKTQDGKLILRKAMKKILPDMHVALEKQGFSAPDASWFRGESIDYVRRLLIDGQPLLYNYLDGNAVKRLVLEHLEGKKNRRLLIWSLINVEQWMQTFMSQTKLRDKLASLMEQKIVVGSRR